MSYRSAATEDTSQHASEATTTRSVLTSATALLASSRISMLLSTSQQTTSQLSHEITRATTRRATMLLSASEKLSSELANEISRAAAMATVVLLATAHERIHREALFLLSACPVSLMPKGVSYA
jgi:hypothetical protein